MLLGDLLSLTPPFEIGAGDSTPVATIGDYMPAAFVVATLLIENLEIGSLPSAEDDNPVFISHEPNIPVTSITIYDTAGIEEMRGQRGDVTIHHGIQVRTRGKNYLTAWQLLNDINLAFAGVENEVVDIDDNEYTVNSITSTSSIITLGPSQQNIVDIFVKNFIVSMTNT